ncbi:MAG: Stf0 family sulfotransferase [Rhizobiaceae bacterium]
MEQFQAYVICTSPRSGSTLLCRLLRNTEIAGFPESHFHDPSISEWLGYYGLKPEEFGERKDALNAVFSAAYETGKGRTGIFGMRLQRHSFSFFVEQLNVLHPTLSTDRSRIEAAVGKTLFIHLTRKNKLEQAISYVKAQQSGLWHMAPDGTELERLSEPKEPTYDYQAIVTQLARFVEMDKEWSAWFAAEQIEPLRVTYDDLSADPHATLARVLEALGIDHAPTDEVAVPVAKLADATNRDWADRFRAEATDLDI